MELEETGFGAAAGGPFVLSIQTGCTGIGGEQSVSSSEERNLKKRVLRALLAVDYRPVTVEQLAFSLRLQEDEIEQVSRADEELIEQGRIREDRRGRLRPRGMLATVRGVVRRMPSGAGWVIPSEKVADLRGGDVYVAARDLRDAQSGDEVLVTLTARRRSHGQRCGVIDRIVERASTVFVGTWIEIGGRGYVRVDGDQFSEPLHVADTGARGPQVNDRVVVEILRFPTAKKAGEAVVSKVLGRHGDPGIDNLSVIYGFGIPHEFPEGVLKEARLRVEQFPDEIPADRWDLTGRTIVTIDPADARDFDDAISLDRTDDGVWHLGVHIADVASLVPLGGPLDHEARERGTSVYLPDYVIPMLPELLSNGLASLQQGELRWTRSVFIDFDHAGMVLGAKMANTVIRVTQRFAYEQVLPIVHGSGTADEYAPEVRRLLQQMYELAMLLRARRRDQGSLEMGIPEIRIDFDEEGFVCGAHERQHDESHQIIEEFMLAANIAVAQYLTTHGIPFLRRVHETPDELKIRGFQQFCQGLDLHLSQPQSRFELQSLIRRVEGRPEQRAVNMALLRSMKQAIYSPEDAGHFALAEEDYCHFTSPIRRYPDLTIHRLIDRIIRDGGRPGDASEELFELGKHCSRTERRAERAEREVIKVRLLRFMEPKVGEEMEAVITGVESFGMFCQGIEIPAEGLIPVNEMSDEYWEFDSAARTMTGSQSRRVFRLGDRIRVLITSVNVDRRQMNLLPVRDGGRSGGRSRRWESQPRGSVREVAGTEKTERRRKADKVAGSTKNRHGHSTSGRRPRNKRSRRK